MGNPKKVLDELGVNDWKKNAENALKEAKEIFAEVAVDMKNMQSWVESTDDKIYPKKDAAYKKVMDLGKKYRLRPDDVLKAFEKGGYDVRDDSDSK